MKKNLHFAKAALLTALLLFGLGYTSMAASYTASVSGNWSSTTTWGGSAGPGFNITAADIIVISSAVTVTLDQDVTINNASATLSVLATGILTGTTNMILTAGTLSGAGTVTLSSLTVGATGWVTSTGPINVGTFANSQATLAIGSIVTVSNMFVLTAGVVQLNTLGAVNLSNGATINIAGGSYSILGGGLLNLAGNFNLVYSGTAAAIGLESTLAGLNNVTVNLATSSGQLSMASDLAVAGQLSLQQGILNLNGHSLTLNGTINTAATGSIMGNVASNIIVNGTGSVGTIAFASTGQTINNLTLNILASGSILLASDVTIGGALSLNGSSLSLNGHNLTLNGTVSAITGGSIIGSGTSGLIVNGTGVVGTLIFGTSGNTLENMTVNVASAGSVLLGSAITVSGTLALNGGSLNLNGQNLTIGGAISTSGTGSVTGNIASNIIFNGTGNAGTLVFTTGSQAINNLTINIGGSGTIALGSNTTVVGTLTLAQGNISIGNYNLTIPTAASVQGGSAASYVVTNAIAADTGSLIMAIANAGAQAMYQVGTIANYAPVNITNNSTLAGVFSVIAHPGVFANGTTGANLATTTSTVNTSWDVTSSLATGNNVNLEMFWNNAMQVNGFDNTQAYISHYTAGAWNTSALTAATAISGGFSLALTGVTSFSPFAVFDKNTTTAIQVIKPEASFSIYPNPAADQLNITIQGVDNLSVLKIYDALGNIITSQHVVNTLAVMDISNLAPGVYYASLNGIVTRRFIKN